MYALKNCKIYTSKSILEQYAVIIKDESILEIVPEEQVDSSLSTVDMKGYSIAPSFVDIQIYGGGGSLFNSSTSIQTIQKTYREIRRSGTSHFQITLSSTPIDKMLEAIEVAKDYLEQGGKGLAGLHLEGPFFSYPKRGAHVAEFIRKPTNEDLIKIVEASKGLPTYMTIAPEEFTKEQLQYLLDSHIIVAAGHSSATYAQATEAFDQGVRRVTHLFNAMSQLQSREPGLVGATYDSDVWASIIPDGVHVSYPTVSISKKMMGNRLFIITDAVTEDTSGDYKFIHAGDRYVDTNGILSGSALSMIQAVVNCYLKVGIPLDESLRMASTYPAQVIKKDHVLGKIEEGYQANMVIFNEDLEIQGIIEQGYLEWFLEI